MSVREQARQSAYVEALGWLSERSYHDFTFLAAKGAEGRRGEARVGYALGVLNALETRRLLDN